MNQPFTKLSRANPFKPVPTEVSVGFKSIKRLTRQQNITKSFIRFALFILLLCCTTQKTQAQYVTIPDTNFVVWLNNNGYAGCMNGNMMDTTCGAVVNATNVIFSNKNISDLTGIQYFDNLTYLYCSYNQLTSLPNLPNSLTYLDCFFNQLTSLPTLPSSLTYLYCSHNQLTNLPTLPNSLTFLDCYDNQLTSLPTLPNSLTYLYCDNNQLTSLPTLPNSLTNLGCSNNQLTSLPTLPNSLTDLHCYNNQLTSLPTLPNSLTDLHCYNNQLTSLPTLPNSLTYLYCDNNQLTSLPALPDSLYYLYCNNNPNLYCLPKLNAIYDFNFTNTGIQCIPNYGNVTNSNPPLSTLPLCNIFNSDGCPSYWNISGNVYADTNSNCISNGPEPKYSNIKLNLYSDGFIEQSTFTNFEGVYSFDTDTGLYTIEVDTTNLALLVVCPSTFYDTAYIESNNLQNENNNFALGCKPGFDVGVKTVLRDSGIFRPANFANVKIFAGDISNHYGLHCAAGTSGAVQIIITGPASYIVTVNGALTPTLNGDTLTYTIADFGLVDFDNDFQIQVQTDTLAQLGQQVCFEVNVTPTIGDNIPANNTLTHCFTVVNSYDPNSQSVYPIDRIENADGKLTYTIQFQNTGNAPAQHIYVMDTLNAALDASTFELLAYSHQPQVQLIGNNLRFNFPNINLPDSTNDEPNSHGYVQFSIKLHDSLPLGTTVNNTSFIYFDFNPPVQTNTVTDTLTDCDNLIANAWFAKTSLCKNDTLFAAMELHYPYNNIKWYVDNVLSANGDSVAISNIGLGTHIIKVVIKTQYCLSKTYYNITVNDLPQPTLGNDTTACAGLVLDGGTGFTNYLWNTGASTQTIIATNSAAYTVTVTDANGCKANDVIVATINPNPQIIFNAFVIDTLCKNAGIQTINPPNPLGGTLTGNGLTGLTFDPSAVATGWNYFYYVYMDSNSCSNAATDSVWVDEAIGESEIGK
ncbi:MAG: leucine-rich repeat domain-containing protein [Bacteroidetes bacterium]|nr:leucine-rich repeat domain-containing protein [Bacteroidota bacterium]